MEAGVFHALPKGGASMTAEEISAQTGLDKNILGTKVTGLHDHWRMKMLTEASTTDESRYSFGSVP